MYKIEITAETLAELAGKTAALAAKLNTGTATEAPTRLRITAAGDLVREVAEAKTPNAETQAAIEEVAKGETVKSETVEAAIAELNEPEAPAVELDFDTDVAPIVLRVVKDKGKPAAQEILAQFGVEKASALDNARWPELIAALQDAL